MDHSAAGIAARFLIWRSRRERRVTRWGAGLSDMQARFVEHLCGLDPGRHRDDVSHAVQDFLVDHVDLAQWWRAALAPFVSAFTLDSGTIGLRQGHLALWRDATSRLDADALLALMLAGRIGFDANPERLLLDLPNWGFFIGTQDHGLRRVTRRGLADIHVHFEASDPLPLLWLRVAEGVVPPDDLNLFSIESLSALRTDHRDHRDRVIDREMLADSVHLRRRLAEILGIRLAPPGRAQVPARAIQAERRLLVAAWQMLAKLGANGHADDDLRETLDGYLCAKNLFLRRHQQHAGQGAGLSRFRVFLDRGETLLERKTKTRPAVRRSRFERMLSLSTTSPDLKVVELRIAPQKTLRGYYDLFNLWDRVFARDDPPRIRFVIHFIRKDASTSRGLPSEHGGLRSTLDRQSAILQQFRHRCPRLARYIVGIDVANFERGFPPEVFTPYLNLLRGDDKLAQGRWDSSVLRAWSSMRRSGYDAEPAGLPPLGATYHAGEDFHHPVDGLVAMSQLLDHVLRPGDRIGHGLAAGADIEGLIASRGSPPMPMGQLLDDLVWLRRESGPHGDLSDGCATDCDDLIDELSRIIFDESPGIRILEGVAAHSFKVPHLSDKNSDRLDVRLAYRRAFDEDTAKARRRMSSRQQVAVLDRASKAINTVQERLMRRIRDGGVVVEACPSSNLVTGAVASLRQHPFFRYRAVLADHNPVCFNTDDPGVFGTTLEIEYGLMFDEMLASGLDRNAALEALEASRRLALEHAFGGPLDQGF